MRARRACWPPATGTWVSAAIDYGFDAELVNFERNVGVTGWRMDVAPRVGLDWSAPGFFVRPSGGFRYTQYSLEDNDAGHRRFAHALAAVRDRSTPASCSNAPPARAASGA